MDRKIIVIMIRTGFGVALRKESVDRKNKTWWVDIHTSGRSPQGERG